MWAREHRKSHHLIILLQLCRVLKPDCAHSAHASSRNMEKLAAMNVAALHEACPVCAFLIISLCGSARRLRRLSRSELLLRLKDKNSSKDSIRNTVAELKREAHEHIAVAVSSMGAGPTRKRERERVRNLQALLGNVCASVPATPGRLCKY